jgi:hypothetical protein
MTLNTSIEQTIVIGPESLSGITFAFELITSVNFGTKQNSCCRIVVDIDKAVWSSWSCSNSLIDRLFGSPTLVTVQTEITAVAHVLTLSGRKLD